MSLDCNYLHALHNSTMRRLEMLQRRVRQGFNVDDASDFASYVLNSNMIDLMKQPETNPRWARVFPHDADQLSKAAQVLRDACCAYYGGKTFKADGTPVGASKSDLEKIDDKLAFVLTKLAQVESRQSTGSASRKPKLRVVRNVA